MFEKLKENLAIIAIIICLVTMVSQCSTCTRVSSVSSSVEAQKKLMDSVLIENSNTIKAHTASVQKIESKIDSAMYGGVTKKAQPNYIVIRK